MINVVLFFPNPLRRINSKISKSILNLKTYKKMIIVSMINNDLSQTSTESMSSNNGIYTLPKSEGYLLAFRQLKLLKPYAGILDNGKDRVEFPSNFLHKSTPSLFPSSFYAFSRAFGVQEHYRKIFECVFTAYELKPKPFPTPNDLDVVSHSMKA